MERDVLTREQQLGLKDHSERLAILENQSIEIETQIDELQQAWKKQKKIE